MKAQRVKSGLIFIICLLGLCQFTYGQTPTPEPTVMPSGSGTLSSSAAVDVQETEEQRFVVEDAVLEKLKESLSAEQLDALTKKVQEVEDRKFSETSLSQVLSQIGLNADDTETVLLHVRAYLELKEKVKEAVPVILSMKPLEDDVQQKEQELEKATSDEQKTKITQDIAELKERLLKRDDTLKDITTGIQKNQLVEAPALLKGMGHTSEEIDTIVNGFQRQILFAEKIGTLETIIESIRTLKQDIGTKTAEQEAAQTEDEKKAIAEDVAKLAERLKDLEQDFTGLITGIDIEAFYEKDAGELVWEDEMKEIFSPIMKGLKDMTERPRRMEKLRSEIMTYEQELPQIQEAVANIGKLRKDARRWGEIATRLEEEEAFWTQQEIELTSKLETAQHKLTEQEQGKRTLSEGLNFFFQSFVKHRGKNLLMAVLAFLTIYIIFYFLRRMLMKYNPLHRFPKYAFLANVIDVLFYLFSFIAATGAMMVVLYSSGDWLILGIMIVLVLGLIWAARDALPQFGDQIKLLLGFGPVRKGERVIYNGIPWKVEAIGVYSYLKNPLLTGGTLRLPLNDLGGMRSRPFDENEPWFPCKPGDWILVNGTAWRCVKLQTPQHVVLTFFDMEEMMPTGSFMSQTIRNLSAAPFMWLGKTVYISYQHRDQVATITKVLEETLTAELTRIFGDNFVEPWIEAAELTNSSIGFWIWARMKSEAASKWGPLNNVHIPQAALKACNEHGWELIRFTHVNLHQPESAGMLQNGKAKDK